MNKNKPLILISNDDGVDAEGLIRLTNALRNLGEIVVFAPDGPRSGMSCAITSSRPITYKKLSQEEGLTVYSCTGTPTDCVKLVLSEVLPVKPDLLVSGINHGGNHALAVHYSGTMGAAFEGCVFSVPSIGVSLDKYTSGSDFSESCRLIRILAEQVLKKGLPDGVYLNLNVPNITKVRGIAVGRQTTGKWEREYNREEKDGMTEYWLTGDFEMSGPAYPDNDITLLDEGYASLVPCKVDVTDYAFRDVLETWDFNR
ncbi:MAG: 5'/3'-nucleotidase SurE [Tannerella sp.]|nr:5'/3'-nucleotidase SurE [Tannerella sp.]